MCKGGFVHALFAQYRLPFSRPELRGDLPANEERGFDTFELWSLDGINLAALKAQKDRFGMRLSACCPSFFILNDERRHEEYEAALRKVAAQASSLDWSVAHHAGGAGYRRAPRAAARRHPQRAAPDGADPAGIRAYAADRAAEFRQGPQGGII